MAWVDDFAAASQGLAQALQDAWNDPAEAIRLLLPLTSWQPPPFPGSGPLAQASNAAQVALAFNLRTNACAALGTAAQRYQPASYQDAAQVRQTVCNALQAHAVAAADAGLDETFAALRQLRADVALYFAVLGANLAFLVDVTTHQPMPSLEEAWRLYQDTTREPQLVGSADPSHPLFLPVEYPALDR